MKISNLYYLFVLLLILNHTSNIFSMFFDPANDLRAYQVLNVAPTATRTEAIKAYRNLALKHHPDKLQEKGIDDPEILKWAGEIMKVINLAKGAFIGENNPYGVIKNAKVILEAPMPTQDANYANKLSQLSSELQSLSGRAKNLSGKTKKNNSAQKQKDLTKISQTALLVKYKLDGISINLIKDDILSIPADAIVNAANEVCLGGSGIDGYISQKGGSSLLKARQNIPEVTTGVRCPEMQARITRAGDLTYPDPANPAKKVPFKYVVHAVGPVCHGASMSLKEKIKLAQTYVNSLKRINAFNKNPKNSKYIEFDKIDISDLAGNYKIESVTFPTISTGIFGCKTSESAEPVINTVIKYLATKANTDLKEINFAFHDPANPAKADIDFNYYKLALDKLVK